MARRPRRTLVVGIDPGNDSSGISVWDGGKLIDHWTWYPWSHGKTLWARDTDLIAAWVFEVPQNGTHDSRGGVHWAAGMIATQLGAVRSRVIKMEPREWRELAVGDGRASKADCLDVARRCMLRREESEDECEAVLIGLAGVRKLGLDQWEE